MILKVVVIILPWWNLRINHENYIYFVFKEEKETDILHEEPYQDTIPNSRGKFSAMTH